MKDERAEVDGGRWRELLVLWLRLDSEQRASLLKLAEGLEKIGPRAASILSLIAARLAVGAEQYGDFTKKRDWAKETVEEHLDAVVYLAVALQELRKES